MYQAKQRLNSFGQPNFLRKNEPKNTFWEEEEEILPFKLSIPEYFTPQAVDTFNEKQKSSRARGNFRPNIVSNHPANKQQTKQRRSHSRSFANRQSDSYIYNRPHSTLQSYFAQKIYTNWIEKELYFSMSKLSFLVLVVGLFFLSSLLFITGFLVAVNIYDIGTLKQIKTIIQIYPS